MKIFAIRDEELGKKNLAYLLYYEESKSFYIELPDDADVWEIPLLLSSFLKQGEYSINSYWSKVWVNQRIVPTDRQNLGMILKDNGLDAYDEFKLLLLGKGRCAQDSVYLVPLKEQHLPRFFKFRTAYKVEDVVPLSNNKLLVFFRDGKVCKCDVEQISENHFTFQPVLNNINIFNSVEVLPGGYGVCWGQNITIADKRLYEKGKPIDLSIDDFKSYVQHRVITSAEAADILDCTRQNLNKMVKYKKIQPIKVQDKVTLFLKTEIQEKYFPSSDE